MTTWSFLLSSRPLRPFDDVPPRAQDAVWDRYVRDEGVMSLDGALVHLDLGTPQGRAKLGEVTGAIGVTLKAMALKDEGLMHEVAALARRVPVGVTVWNIDDVSALAQLDSIVALDASHAKKVPLADLPKLVSLHLENVSVTEARMREIAALPLEQLSLYYCPIASAEPVAELRGLRALRLHTLKSSEEFRHVAELTGLGFLELHTKQLAVTDLDQLADLREVTSLTLVTDTIAKSDRARRGIGALTSLERLELQCNEEVKLRWDPLGPMQLPALAELWTVGWPHMAQLLGELEAPALKNLVVIGEETGGGGDLAWAPRFGSLASVMVPLRDPAGLVRLRELAALRDVSLRGELDDISALAGLPLERLNLHNTKVGDAIGPTLATLVELRDLDLGMTGVTDAIAPALAKLDKLEEIDLHCASVGEPTFAVLAKLPALRVLEAGRTGANDACVMHLADKQTLRELDLSRADVTDAAMKIIGGLRGLQKLWLRDVETSRPPGSWSSCGSTTCACSTRRRPTTARRPWRRCGRGSRGSTSTAEIRCRGVGAVDLLLYGNRRPGADERHQSTPGRACLREPA